ncbi:MAG TPA: YihY/virulence factor BrkB family protein, partial [Candidatus Avimonoglobus intestinipullorum]|nr:YihY/virulence factor BrkB family protein [Candidatus Avimonoglobus intestinipullorum]
LVYKTFSGKKMPYKRHLPGAVFTTAGWMVFSFLFSIYIENFANYSYIYGSLTAIVLMMLWLYSCMIILLFGAELNMLNQIYKERKQKKWEN